MKEIFSSDILILRFVIGDKKILPSLACLVFLLEFVLNPELAISQVNFTNVSNIKVNITGLPSPVCGNVFSKYQCRIKNPQSRTDLTFICANSDTFPLAQRVRMKADTTYQITIEVSPKTLVLSDLGIEREKFYGGPSFRSQLYTSDTMKFLKETSTTKSYTVNVKFPTATMKGSLTLNYTDGLYNELMMIPVI